MLRDGSYAWEIKDFLVNQERCLDVTVEGQVYPGKRAKKSDGAKNEIKNRSKKQKGTDKKSETVLDDNRTSKRKEDL